MKVGDLVKMRFGASLPGGVGIVVEEYHLTSASSSHQYSELRVQWLDDGGKDVSWVLRKDLDIINEDW